VIAQVGYCQGLNYLAGMLLLVLQKHEERAFWILVSLLDEGGSSFAQLMPFYEQGMYAGLAIHSTV
jgi:hypothetical protein